MFYTLKKIESGVPVQSTFSTTLDGLLTKISMADPMTEELRAIGLELERFEVQGPGEYPLANSWWLSVTNAP